MKKTTYIFITLLLTFLSSCDDFDDINSNPNATEKVNSQMLATGAILGAFEFDGRDAKSYISDNAIPKYLAYANEGQLSSQYNSFGSASFDNLRIIPNIEKMIDISDELSNSDSYKALGLYLKSYIAYNLTMKVGEIPYEEAGLAEQGNSTPKYNTQEEIFIKILDDLELASQLFSNSPNFEGDPTPYEGNSQLWSKASNLLSLRVLLSLSNKTTSDSNIKIEDRFKRIVNENNLLENNSENLRLQYSSTHPHPLSGTNPIFTSNTLLSELIVNNLKNLKDRRLFYFGEPALDKLNEGLSKNEYEAYVGAKVSDPYNEITNNFLEGKYSVINDRYLDDMKGDDRIILSYAEQCFILAEAKVLGWINNGSAEDYYKMGVTASLKRFNTIDNEYAHEMMINDDYINNYFNQSNTQFGTDNNEQLKQIWLQKYIMNFMIDPYQAYFDYRRTGYPEFSIDPSTTLNDESKNELPKRWTYPNSEYNYNLDNLKISLDRQFNGVDDPNEAIWILN